MELPCVESSCSPYLQQGQLSSSTDFLKLWLQMFSCELTKQQPYVSSSLTLLRFSPGPWARFIKPLVLLEHFLIVVILREQYKREAALLLKIQGSSWLLVLAFKRCFSFIISKKKENCMSLGLFVFHLLRYMT